jgi:hypothetical protein
MDDPHVAELVYALTTPDGTRSIIFEPQNVIGSTDAFEWMLDGTNFTLTIKPRSHFSTIDDSRAALEGRIASWAAYWGIESGTPLRFEYRSGAVVDRQNSGPHATIHSQASVHAFADVSAWEMTTA